MPSPPDAYSFGHLLGLVAAGGTLDPERGRLSLRFARASPFVVSGAIASLVLTAPGRPVRWVRAPGGRSVDVLECTWAGWRALLPPASAGAAPACVRCALTDWQRAIVEQEPHACVRGLLEAGGVRTENRVVRGSREYAYPRYLLRSGSPTVRELLCESCERIGVHWTQSGPRTISVAARESVARLDAFVGEPAA